MMPLSIGDEVRAGTYRLHSRFRRAVNYTDGRRLVSVVGEEIGAGPLNIVVRRIPRRNSEILEIDNDLLAEARRFQSGLEDGCTNSETLRLNLNTLQRVLVEESHPKSLAFLLDERRIRNFRSGFERAVAGQVCAGVSLLPSVAGVRQLAGLGFGLTPSGDDFIAGMLIALNILGQPRRLIRTLGQAAMGDNDLSNAFLRLAREGRMTEKQQELVSALLHRGRAEVKAAARRVLAVGETSGADWAVGFVMTAKSGVVECWSGGVMGRKKTPLFQHSNTPVLQRSLPRREIRP